VTDRPTGVSVVIPTLGRPSLSTLLTALAGAAVPSRAVPATAAAPPGPAVEILLVDDRREPTVELTVPNELVACTRVLRGRSGGPAAARNVGWRAAAHEWVAFLDDDVRPDPDWWYRLVEDLTVGPDVGGVQGRVRVPLPAWRRPTDWERVTAGLADGDWITADMAYRRSALATVGGFDERFRRAFREDAELAYRVRATGWSLRRGARVVTHPVRPEDRWVSVRTQRGNADDALLRRLYGARWRAVLEVPPGRRRRHALVVAFGGAALACAAIADLTGHRTGHRTRRRAGRWTGSRTPRRGWWLASAVAAAAWAAGTAEFAAARIAPGPRTPDEVATMVLSSAVIPPVAVVCWWGGWRRWRGARPVPGRPASGQR
jgi:glycosyltransferase involved in cell wall biosynthesis